MRVLTKLVAGGVFAAALIGAAPAVAQYYPGYPGYGYGGGYSGYGGYGANSQVAVGQCSAAVQQRLNGGGYGYNPYGYNGSYGYNGYGYGPQARVLGVSRIEQNSSGGLTVRGVATSGRYAGYGFGYGGEQRPDLVWRCRTDYRGFIRDIDVDPAQRTYGGYGNAAPYNGYDYDYSQYGYRRY